MKTLKVPPALLAEVEKSSGYTDFSSFAREALEAYVEALKSRPGGKVLKEINQSLEPQKTQPPKRGGK